MDYQEAIKELASLKEHCCDMIDKEDKESIWIKDCEALNIAISAIQELQGYKQLGTLEEVREAVEKQKAKKPILDKSLMILECPSCGNFLQKVVDNEGSTKGFIQNYCRDCGQKIDADWSEEE